MSVLCAGKSGSSLKGFLAMHIAKEHPGCKTKGIVCDLPND
jgi:hypothetical protein